jgi:hypothetical protein
LYLRKKNPRLSVERSRLAQPTKLLSNGDDSQQACDGPRGVLLPVAVWSLSLRMGDSHSRDDALRTLNARRFILQFVKSESLRQFKSVAGHAFGHWFGKTATFFLVQVGACRSPGPRNTRVSSRGS